MKSEYEVRRQLEDVYEHRFTLRVGRKTKRCCRNCLHGIECQYDFGEFGIISKWGCLKNQVFSGKCGFECVNDIDSIEREMLADIADPSVCGAKEPKIAALLWVLHDGGQSMAKHSDKQDKAGSTGFFQKIVETLRGRR